MNAPIGPAHLDAARDLLAESRLDADALEVYLARALAIPYWQSLAPDLHVGGAAPVDGLARSDLGAALEAGMRTFREGGYCRVAEVFPEAATAGMYRALTALRAAGWPSVFAWIYDECWSALRQPSLRGLLDDLLGAPCRQTPYVWTHVVAGHRGAAGWPPHRDNKGNVPRVTVWIPLTDATVETGCICVVPRDVLAGSGSPWHERDVLSLSDVRALLHAARPLPARAGSLVAWDAGLMHWGAVRQQSGEPRVSLSMELVRADADASVREGSLAIDDHGLPSHQQRLGIIASALLLYQSSEARAARFGPLAERLLRELPVRAT